MITLLLIGLALLALVVAVLVEALPLLSAFRRLARDDAAGTPPAATGREDAAGTAPAAVARDDAAGAAPAAVAAPCAQPTASDDGEAGGATATDQRPA